MSGRDTRSMGRSGLVASIGLVLTLLCLPASALASSAPHLVSPSQDATLTIGQVGAFDLDASVPDILPGVTVYFNVSTSPATDSTGLLTPNAAVLSATGTPAGDHHAFAGTAYYTT